MAQDQVTDSYSGGHEFKSCLERHAWVFLFQPMLVFQLLLLCCNLFCFPFSGTAANYMEQYSKAVDLLKEAIALAREHDPDNLSTYLINLGMIYLQRVIIKVYLSANNLLLICCIFCFITALNLCPYSKQTGDMTIVHN